MKTQDIGLRSVAAPRPWTPGNTPTSVGRAERRGSSASAVLLRQISGLAGQAYADSPAGVRAQLLENLLRPMTPYSLISVAGGVFAQIKGRNAEWQGFRIRAEDIADVGAHDVAALVGRVHHVNGDAIDGLVKVMEASPMLARSRAASALIALGRQQKNTWSAGNMDGSNGSGAIPSGIPIPPPDRVAR